MQTIRALGECDIVLRSLREGIDTLKAELARRMQASGRPVTTIATALGVSRATVYRMLADE